MKKFRNPNDIHKPLAAYSHQVELDSNEKLLILSGQVGMMKDGTIPEDPITQLKTALENIEINLKAANMQVKDIIKITFYLADQVDINERRTMISEFLGDHEPCMTLLYVASLATPEIKIEIEAMASRAI